MKPQTKKMLEQADALIGRGDPMAAVRYLDACIKKRPKDVILYLALARTIVGEIKNPMAATKAVRQALKLAPSNQAVLEEALGVFFECKLNGEAERLADQLARNTGKTAPQFLLIYNTYLRLQRFDDAQAVLDKAAARHTKDLGIKEAVAQSLVTKGQFESATKCATEILELKPHSAPAIAAYVRSQKLVESDPVIAKLEHKTIPELREKGNLALASALTKHLVKALNDRGEFVTAFQQILKAKEMHPYEHDRAQMRTYVSAMQKGLSASDFFGSFTGATEERPVLIVGLPRAGSTLLENILAGHPDVASVGESEAMRSLLQTAKIRRRDALAMARLIQSGDSNLFGSINEQYLEQTAKFYPAASRVVDKNLLNFEFLGLFAKLFPKGRVFHALRDPMDHCVSCFMSPLSSFHSYTQDLTSMGQFYREHREMMDHWKIALPIKIMEVAYEDVIADNEGMARQVIEFLGLDWKPACLDFQGRGREVRTLSSWQVRQPIYNTSVRRWKRYEEYLDPLKKELAIFYPDGFDV